MTKKEENQKYAKKYRELADDLMALHSKASNVISRKDNNCIFELSCYLKAVAKRIRGGYRNLDYRTFREKSGEEYSPNDTSRMGVKDEFGRPGIVVCREEFEKLRQTIDQLEPHEHFEGMNECPLCDESLLLAAIRLLKKVKPTPG